MDINIQVLTKQNSYLSQVMYEIRDRNLQADRRRFRQNLEKIGSILAYEISKNLEYVSEEITTQLGIAEVKILKEQPVLVSILRAGIPLHNGFLDMFDKADNGFISAYRHHTQGNEFIIKMDYMAVPELQGRDVILIDPMIATGRSIVLCYKALRELGEPKSLHIAGVIASEEGLNHVLSHIPQAKIYVADVDFELTARSYIVPGLGDAGDLAFGEK